MAAIPPVLRAQDLLKVEPSTCDVDIPPSGSSRITFSYAFFIPSLPIPLNPQAKSNMVAQDSAKKYQKAAL